MAPGLHGKFPNVLFSSCFDLKTQAGDISPYFLRELITITCVEHKSKIFLSLSRHIEKQLGKRSKKTSSLAF